jgi:hypothetical protein
MTMRHDEGFTKFTANHTPGELAWSPELDELDAARTELHDFGLVGVYPDGIGFGNLSLRLGDAGSFAITGAGTGGRRRLGPGGYAVVEKWDGGRNEVWCRGPVKASSESMSHGAVYRACPAAACVVHVHSPRLFGRMLAGNSNRTPADAQFGTPALAGAIEALVAQLAHANGVFALAGHEEGVIAYGRTVREAMDVLFAECRQRDVMLQRQVRGGAGLPA